MGPGRIVTAFGHSSFATNAGAKERFCDAMDDQVRIAANGRGEVRIAGRGQGKVAFVVL